MIFTGIDFYGNTITPTQQEIDKWNFSGLNNFDFLMNKVYEDHLTDV